MDVNVYVDVDVDADVTVAGMDLLLRRRQCCSASVGNSSGEAMMEVCVLRLRNASRTTARKREAKV